MLRMRSVASRGLRRHAATSCDGNVFAALAADERVVLPVTAIVAHPDDEVIGMGSRLYRLKNLTLVHATNGAPSNMRRARALGFDSAEAYSRARYEELRTALAIAGANPVHQTVLGFSDGETVFHLAALVECVTRTLSGAVAVITHAYEGGHPDHDTCALATHLACARIAAGGGAAPQHLEFAGYYARGGRLAANCFWPDPRCPEMQVHLSWQQRRRKRKAMRAFRTQSFILQDFPPTCECYRLAPIYDFQMPPPPDEWYYDQHDWALKGKVWLQEANRYLSTAKLFASALPVAAS